MQTYLKKEATKEIVNFPHPATATMVWYAVASLPQCSPLRVAILLSFSLAQRCADVIRLRCVNIFVLAEVGLLGIKFVEGKVTPKTGPYSLHLGLRTQVAQELLVLTKQRKATNNKYLFLQTGSDKERNKMGETIKHQLRKADPRLEQRSLRRGALSTMALNGATVRQLLYYSKHKSEEMLMRYLDWGMYNIHMALEAVEASKVLVPEDILFTQQKTGKPHTQSM